MSYRKYLADRVFDGFRFQEKGMVVIVNEEGTLLDIIPQQAAGDEITLLKGILVPGLVNAHCHLELSHMKDVIPAGTGLVDFLISVVKKRERSEAVVQQKAEAAEKEMYANGIVAVADIANTSFAVTTKKSSMLRWHNLIEVLNFFDNSLPQRWSHNEQVLAAYLAAGTNGVLTPHAPYSVSVATFRALNEVTKGKIISIHNQETRAENELFETGSGAFLRMFAETGIGASPFEVSGKSSLQTWLPHFTNGQQIILVHNTYISEEDILFATTHAEQYGLTLAYCLCPNANQYIEQALPPVDMLIHHQCTILLGTDSYSSNWELNMAKEIHTLQTHFPHHSLERWLQYATSTSADFFGWKDLGRLRKGTKPGLVLLEMDALQQITGKAERII